MSDTTHEAPERIWTCNETDNIWIPCKQDDTTEYVRADMLQEIFARYSKAETAHIEELEAKLAKAIEVMSWVRYGNGPNGESAFFAVHDLLEELKGQDDEC